ncbi:hypothetical protein [Streptomyces sp. NPDC006307]|uniref:hypothetical protein n=1 Tax=Streptomyces sp. NPDC006307 TaxID=3156748 RepID=UPI0033B091E3
MRFLIANRYSDNFADHGEYLGHARYQVSGVTIADHVPMIPPGQGRIGFPRTSMTPLFRDEARIAWTPVMASAGDAGWARPSSRAPKPQPSPSPRTAASTPSARPTAPTTSK